MSGHSKWSQIKHKKRAADQKRGQLFSKLSKMISIAARKGINPDANIELKNAIEKARTFNMPGENIERAIKRAADKDIAQLNAIRIEAVGQNSSAFIIEAITDNSNRTISEIKNIFKNYDIKMVQPNSLMWMFSKADGDFTPNNPLEIKDEKLKTKIKNFLEELDNNEDIKEIYYNISNLS